MLVTPTRLALVAALLLPLCGCGNSPQQPSDAIDDKTAESPRLGDSEGVAEPSPDLAELDDPVDEPPDDSVVTGSLPAPPPTLDAVAGRWAADAAACEVEDGPAVVISSTSFESPERVCRVVGTTDGGSGSITATLSCPEGDADEGDSELVKLTPDDQNLTLSFVGGDQPDQTLSRCP